MQWAISDSTIEVYDTELKQSAPKVYIRSPLFRSMGFKSIICSVVELLGIGNIDVHEIKDVFVVVNKANKATEVVVKYENERSETIYDTVGINPELNFISKGEKVEGPINTVFDQMAFLLKRSGVEVGDMGKILEGQVIPPPGVLEFEEDPLEKVTQEKHGIKLKVSDDLPQEEELKGSSVIIANHVLMHFSARKRAQYINELGGLLRENGVLVIKNHNTEGVEIEVYQRKGDQEQGLILRPIGRMMERSDNKYTADGIFAHIGTRQSKRSMMEKIWRHVYSLPLTHGQLHILETRSAWNNYVSVFDAIQPESEVEKAALAYLRNLLMMDIPDFAMKAGAGGDC